LQYSFKRVKVNQDGLKLNGKFRLIIYADCVTILGESVHTIKKLVKTLAFASKEFGLEVNAD